MPPYNPETTYSDPVKLDSYDKKIISELDANARVSLTYLSRKIKLSRDCIKNRINKLIANRTIIGFKPIYNSPSLGFPIINYVFISLYNPTEEKEADFIKYIQNKKQIIYLASLVGKYDYFIEIMAKSQGDFDKVLKELRHKYPDLIKDYEIFGTIQEYKYEAIGKIFE